MGNFNSILAQFRADFDIFEYRSSTSNRKFRHFGDFHDFYLSENRFQYKLWKLKQILDIGNEFQVQFQVFIWLEKGWNFADSLR
jgi:hypothetical protein